MIVQLIGGLGNQMFQWAFGQSLSAQLKTSVHYYVHPRIAASDDHIAYTLDKYEIAVPKFTSAFASLPVFHEKGPGVYDSRVQNGPRDAMYSGYWQTEKYFFNPDAIRAAFIRPKGQCGDRNDVLSKMILNSPDTAFVHVRRGDYVNTDKQAYHGLMTADYYREGMKEIRKKFPKTHFFIFSDDPLWCHEYLQDVPHSCTLVSHNHWRRGTAQWDIWLMSLCNRGGVISNSSFGWWGAWLGDTWKDRVVVAPKKWFVADIPSDDIVPERWVKL